MYVDRSRKLLTHRLIDVFDMYRTLVLYFWNYRQKYCILRREVEFIMG